MCVCRNAEYDHPQTRHYSGPIGPHCGRQSLDPAGRWPANLIHDGSEEVLACFPETGLSSASVRHNGDFDSVAKNHEYAHDTLGHADNGGAAARFFASFPQDEEISQIEEVGVEWISEHGPRQVLLLVDTEQSQERAIVESSLGDEHGWNMFLFGNGLTDLSQKAFSCTTEMATNSIIESKIWNWLLRSFTNASIPVANCGMENGGSHAANVDPCNQSLIIIVGQEAASLPGANHAVFGTPLKISVREILPRDSQKTKRISYTSKAGKDDRLGSSHPTIKPLDLIQYLVRLITPKNGVVLDCFSGTGTTGEAAFREGFRSILIEREAEYINDIERRMSLVMEGPVTRANAGMKARGRPVDNGPLFGGAAGDDTARSNLTNATYQSGCTIGPIGMNKSEEEAKSRKRVDRNCYGKFARDDGTE